MHISFNTQYTAGDDSVWSANPQVYKQTNSIIKTSAEKLTRWWGRKLCRVRKELKTRSPTQHSRKKLVSSFSRHGIWCHFRVTAVSKAFISTRYPLNSTICTLKLKHEVYSILNIQSSWHDGTTRCKGTRKLACCWGRTKLNLCTIRWVFVESETLENFFFRFVLVDCVTDGIPLNRHKSMCVREMRSASANNLSKLVMTTIESIFELLTRATLTSLYSDLHNISINTNR